MSLVSSAITLGYFCIISSGYLIHVYLGTLVPLTMVASSLAALMLMPSLLVRIKPQFLLKKTSPQYKTRLLIKSGQSWTTVFEKDVAYFLSDRKLTFLVTHAGNKQMMDESRDELEGQLTPHEFFRLNRAIAAMHKFFNGKLKLQLKPPTEHEVIVSREKAKAFREWLDQ